MKLIFVYDSLELFNIARINKYIAKDKHLFVLTTESNTERYLYDVATVIVKKTSGKEKALIFIDQYLRCADEEFKWLQNNAGIALIKFLRMMEVKQHIVLITPFEPMQLIKQDLGNLIVTSSGISLSKYLFEYRSKSLEELNELAINTFVGDLKPYINIDFQLPQDERHDWANWWGIDRLWNIHTSVDASRFGSRDRWNLAGFYPHEVEKKLKELNNFKALFFFDHNDIIKRDYLEKLKRIQGDYLFDLRRYKEGLVIIEKAISQIEDQLESNQKKLTLDKQTRDVIGDTDLIESLAKLQDWEHQLLVDIDNKDESYKLFLNRLNNDDRTLFEQLEDFKIRLNKAVKIIKDKLIKFSIPELRTVLQQKMPKILYIDDQANDGWGDIFQYMIYGSIQEKSIFRSLPNLENNNSSEIGDLNIFYKYVSDTMRDLKPDVVLLDLRLQGEKGTWINAENLSGAFILGKLRQNSESQNLPVIITTASNKSWSYDELRRVNNFFEGGQMYYWVKEGVDVILNEEESVMNYARFLALVVLSSCNNEFQYLIDKLA